MAQSLRIQGQIDLTQYALNKTLPLRYELSNVAAHDGPGNNVERSIIEIEAYRMDEHRIDPENDETIRRKRSREEEELMQLRLSQLAKLRDVPRIDIHDEAGWPARDMSPETMQNIEDFTEILKLDEDELVELEPKQSPAAVRHVPQSTRIPSVLLDVHQRYIPRVGIGKSRKNWSLHHSFFVALGVHDVSVPSCL